MSDELRKYITDILDDDKVSLINVRGGAAVDLFDRQLARVMQNIADPNTSTKAREIILKMQIAPINDDRSLVGYKIDVPPAKLCGQDPVEGHADLAICPRGGGHYAKIRPEQQQLAFKNVVEIEK